MENMAGLVFGDSHWVLLLVLKGDPNKRSPTGPNNTPGTNNLRAAIASLDFSSCRLTDVTPA